MNKLYMFVTSDAYELPMFVGDSMKELAKASGRKYGSLNSIKSRGQNVKAFGVWCKIIEVNLS